MIAQDYHHEDSTVPKKNSHALLPEPSEKMKIRAASFEQAGEIVEKRADGRHWRLDAISSDGRVSTRAVGFIETATGRETVLWDAGWRR